MLNILTRTISIIILFTLISCDTSQGNISNVNNISPNQVFDISKFKAISTGLSKTCVLYDKTVQCWGYWFSLYFDSNIYEFTNPTDLSVGDIGFHLCVIDESSVRCLGRDAEGQSTPPPLNNPIAIDAGEYHTCALDNDGVKCWGSDSHGKTNAPSLNQPTAVGANLWDSCAIDGNNIICWGAISAIGPVNMSDLHGAFDKPRRIVMGEGDVCVVEQSRIRCWDSLSPFILTDDLPITNVTDLSVGAYHACAIADSEVTCWGENFNGQLDVPILNGPIAVSAGAGHTCAVDLDGVKCWGRNDYGQLDVPSNLINN